MNGDSVFTEAGCVVHDHCDSFCSIFMFTGCWWHLWVFYETEAIVFNFIVCWKITSILNWSWAGKLLNDPVIISHGCIDWLGQEQTVNNPSSYFQTDFSPTSLVIFSRFSDLPSPFPAVDLFSQNVFSRFRTPIATSSAKPSRSSPLKNT